MHTSEIPAMSKEAQEKLLRELAKRYGIDQATKVVEEAFAKSIIKRFRITRIEQLAVDAKVRPMISERDRQLVINYLNGSAK